MNYSVFVCVCVLWCMLGQEVASKDIPQETVQLRYFGQKPSFFLLRYRYERGTFVLSLDERIYFSKTGTSSL